MSSASASNTSTSTSTSVGSAATNDNTTSAVTPPPPPPSFQNLTATYTSPTHLPFSYNHQLSTPTATTSTDPVASRISYLSQLRKATAELQQEINQELSARMEEDKTRGLNDVAEKGKMDRSGKALDDAKEEANYGEEAVEEDE